jgi:glycerol kinase
MGKYILAIDQGTTNSRAIVFNKKGKLLSHHEIALQQFFPDSGWVEQNPEEIFKNTLICCREAVKKSNLTIEDITAIGISNQRETTIIWDKHSGRPVYPAIVWQDRRTSETCKILQTKLPSDFIQKKTGLLLDPYFSATKIMWILENVPGVKARAHNGDLLFGTIDTYIVWKLTKGKSHVTDASNASRTMLYDIREQAWDQQLLQAFAIPDSLLPNVLDNAADFGVVEPEFLGKSIPVTGMAGDQQAATVGQACFYPGMVKTTFGTGCFMLLNTGSNIILSRNKLISTIAYRINNKVTYGLEGSIFSAGVTVKWLRDKLKLIKTSAETELLSKNIDSTNGVYLIPAFTGLGAPYWDPDARGALVGLTHGCDVAHIARAALESVAYQTRDLLDAMARDYRDIIDTMRVDGGMAANNWLMQFQADMTGIKVQRPACIETSALGAAYLAGLQTGMYGSLQEISELWKMNAEFEPNMDNSIREKLYHGWQAAVARTLNNHYTQ